MKVLEGMFVQKMGDSYVTVPIGRTKDRFQGVVQRNKSGAEIFEALFFHKSAEKNVSQIHSMSHEASLEIACGYMDGILHGRNEVTVGKTEDGDTVISVETTPDGRHGEELVVAKEE